MGSSAHPDKQIYTSRDYIDPERKPVGKDITKYVEKALAQEIAVDDLKGIKDENLTTLIDFLAYLLERRKIFLRNGEIDDVLYIFFAEYLKRAQINERRADDGERLKSEEIRLTRIRKEILQKISMAMEYAFVRFSKNAEQIFHKDLLEGTELDIIDYKRFFDEVLAALQMAKQFEVAQRELDRGAGKGEGSTDRKLEKRDVLKRMSEQVVRRWKDAQS